MQTATASTTSWSPPAWMTTLAPKPARRGSSFGTGGDLDGSSIPDLLIGIPGCGDRDTGTAYGAALLETF
jgi:hypothetical protein